MPLFRDAWARAAAAIALGLALPPRSAPTIRQCAVETPCVANLDGGRWTVDGGQWTVDSEHMDTQWTADGG